MESSDFGACRPLFGTARNGRTTSNGIVKQNWSDQTTYAMLTSKTLLRRQHGTEEPDHEKDQRNIAPEMGDLSPQKLIQK